MTSGRLDVAVEAVRAAAKVISRFDKHRGDLRVMEKGPGDLVTNADLLAEETVLRLLAERFPDDGVLSEEMGQKGDTAACWVLDPLDGTNNFIHGVPHYAVSLAWCNRGVPELGVIYDICRNEIYTAERGRGALCEQRRIRVAETRRMRDAMLVSTGAWGPWPWFDDDADGDGAMASRIRRLGAVTLDFGLVARGAVDAAVGNGMQYWDYAAGIVLLREAGGTFWTDAGEDEAEFGAPVSRCVFGTRRIVGNLRRRLPPRDSAARP